VLESHVGDLLRHLADQDRGEPATLPKTPPEDRLASQAHPDPRRLSSGLQGWPERREPENRPGLVLDAPKQAGVQEPPGEPEDDRRIRRREGGQEESQASGSGRRPTPESLVALLRTRQGLLFEHLPPLRRHRRQAEGRLFQAFCRSFQRRTRWRAQSAQGPGGPCPPGTPGPGRPRSRQVLRHGGQCPGQVQGNLQANQAGLQQGQADKERQEGVAGIAGPPGEAHPRKKGADEFCVVPLSDLPDPGQSRAGDPIRSGRAQDGAESQKPPGAGLGARETAAGQGPHQADQRRARVGGQTNQQR
jgi:hypothetical protein